MEEVATAQSTWPQPRPRGFNPWTTSIVLALIYTASFLDRSVLSLLVEPIKYSFGLSDLHMSLLLGAAFSVFYSLMTIPAGALVDRIDRRKLLFATGLCWSAASISCGLATQYWEMFLARIALGCAEAFVSPAAFALLRDRVPLDQRGRSFSIMGMATFTGAAMSLILGGTVLRAAMTGRFADALFIGALEPWQITIVSVGLLAFLPVLLLVFIAPDGKRPEVERRQGGFGAAYLHLRGNGAGYANVISFNSAASMMAFSLNSWMATMMVRSFGLPLPEVGITFGSIALLSGLSGLMASGFAIDRIARGSGRYSVFAAVSLAIAGLAATAVPLVSHAWQAWLAYGASSFFTGASYPLAAGMLARLTPSPLMGKITAIYLICQNLAVAISASLVAILAEHVFAGRFALANAMAVICALTGGLAAFAASKLERNIRVQN